MASPPEAAQETHPWKSGLLLDCEKHWVLSPSEYARFGNALGRARAYYAGMAAIARRVEAAERVAAEREATLSAGGRMLSWGMVPGLEGEQALELFCDFDAFAIMADCYVRICAFVATERGWLPNVTADRNQYRAAAHGDPLIWYRDKVSAHPVGASANPRDSEAERWMSCATRLSYANQSIIVGGESVEFGSSSVGPGQWQWGVSEVFAKMKSRYWRTRTSQDEPQLVSEMSPRIGMVLPATGAVASPIFDLGALASISIGKPMDPRTPSPG